MVPTGSITIPGRALVGPACITCQTQPRHRLKENGALWWPTCPSQWVWPSDAHPTIPHGQEMGGGGNIHQTGKIKCIPASIYYEV